MDILKFIGNSIADIRKFPKNAKREIGYQLHQLQLGFEPNDWKPVKNIGPGVREIRIHKDGEFRVIYVTRIHGTIYVLHAFQKKTDKTLQRDIELARSRFKLIKEVST